MSSHSSSQMNNKMLPILPNIKASVLLLSHKVGYTENPFSIILGFGSNRNNWPGVKYET